MRNIVLLFVKSGKLHQRVFIQTLIAFFLGGLILVLMPHSTQAMIVSDNFNRANGGLGPSWGNLSGANVATIYSNAVGYASNQLGVLPYWVATSTPYSKTDQFSQATIAGTLNNPSSWYVTVHQTPINSDTNYAGGFNLSTEPGRVYYITRFDNGTEVPLVVSTQVAALNDVVRLEIRGTQLRLLVNGVSILTTTDSTHASGDVGFGLNGNDPTIGLFDNWSGGDLGGLTSVTSRSDKLSNSRPSATSNHTFAFTTNTAIYGSSVSGSSTLGLVFDPAFAVPAGMDCGDVDAATSVQFNFNYPGCVATATAWGFSATGFTFTLVPPSGTGVYVPTSTQITINLGSNATVGQQGSHWITNPSTAGIYTISVGGTFGGSGNILVSINSAVSVQVAVAESLAFTVSSVAAVNCTADDGATVTAIGTSPTTVSFGTLFPANTFFFGCQDLVVSTNAGGGYSLTVQEQTLMQTLGGFTIPQTTCDAAACTLTTAAAWTNAANNGFGHTCANQTNHDCASTYSSGNNFRPTANVAAGDTPQVIMSSSTPASATGRIKYRVSAGSSQPAGDYKTVITFTITPTY